VELPETVMAGSQNKIPVGSGGVKGVRIGMDGKTPPTTSVVVDLDKALAYEIAPSAAGKLVLVLHTQDGGATIAKNGPAPVKSTTPAPVAKVQVATSAPGAPKVVDAKAPAAKPIVVAKVADAKAPLENQLQRPR